MKEKLLELLWDLENYKYPDYDKKADEILLLFNVVGRSEQFKALDYLAQKGITGQQAKTMAEWMDEYKSL